MKVFISYSHKDESYKNKLESHLSNLKRSGKVTTWNDRRIRPGEEWDKEIRNELINADIILLLISSDFISSDYCYDIEVAKAVEYHNANEKIVVPIIIRFCDWSDTPFSKIQALPKNATPIDSKEWTTDDEAYVNIINGIKKLLVRDDSEKQKEFEIEKKPALNSSNLEPPDYKSEKKIEFKHQSRKNYILGITTLCILIVLGFSWYGYKQYKNDKERSQILNQLKEIQGKLITESKKLPIENDSISGFENSADNNRSTDGDILKSNLKYWNIGDTIKIAFLDGTPELKDFVKKVSKEWLLEGGIDLYFKFDVDHLDSDVRISFEKFSGSWSYVGTDALNIAKKSPTTNLGILRTSVPLLDRRQTVLHEFGHILGLIHEHQSPGIVTEWNWKKLYSDLGGSPNFWTKETIENNFKISNENDIFYKNKPFDPSSVMMYEFPSTYFKKPIEITKTGKLSKGDVRVIQSIYKKKSEV